MCFFSEREAKKKNPTPATITDAGVAASSSSYSTSSAKGSSSGKKAPPSSVRPAPNTRDAAQQSVPKGTYRRPPPTQPIWEPNVDSEEEEQHFAKDNEHDADQVVQEECNVEKEMEIIHRDDDDDDNNENEDDEEEEELDSNDESLSVSDLLTQLKKF